MNSCMNPQDNLTGLSGRIQVPNRIIAVLLTGLLVFAGPAVAKPDSVKPMPVDSSRIDEYLTPASIVSEITLTQAKAQELISSVAQSQLFSATAAASSLEATPLRMAPMAINNALIKLKPNTPGEPDITVTSESNQAKVSLKTDTGPVTWPVTAGRTVDVVHVMSHQTFASDVRMLTSMLDHAQNAASHPVAVILSKDELLFAQSSVREVSKRKVQFANGSSHTDRDYAYKTGLLAINLSALTPDPMESFQVVLSAEQGGKGWLRYSIPFIWLIPMTNGQLDVSRFGFKIGMSSELTGVSGIPGVLMKQSWKPVGLVTRVRLEGGNPSAPAASPASAATAAQPGAPTPTAPEAAQTPALTQASGAPGELSDPLLKRPAGPNDPMTWGIMGSFGGGVGIKITETKDVIGAFPGTVAAWYGTGQVGFDATPRLQVASAVLRGGPERDTDYFGGGLAVGKYEGLIAAGPRFTNSRSGDFWGLSMIHGFTLDLLFGKRTALTCSQHLSFRVPVGNGIFILPGGFLNFDMAVQSDDLPGYFVAEAGLQLKIAVNGNVKKTK